MHLTFRISSTAETEARIRALGAVASMPGAKVAAGGALRESIVNHLRSLGPNKRFPGATTGFYNQAAESVTAPVSTETGASVSITQVGMRQRYLGGVIRQNTPGKTYLTIPALGFAYGMMAREITGLKFAFVRNEDGYLAPALIAGDAGASQTGARLKTVRRKKGDAYGPLPGKPQVRPEEVIFWLVRSVNQEPDPNVLPTEAEMQRAVSVALKNFMLSREAMPGEEN